MACVEAVIPVPNSRKKTDELFLYWLSEPSTQELLRKELAKLSGSPFSDEADDKNVKEIHPQTSESNTFLSPSSAVTNVLRPGSPNVRTPSPPLFSHRSPKSPRGARRSPKKTGKSPNRAKNGLQHSFDELDSGDDTSVNIVHPHSSSTMHNHFAEEANDSMEPAPHNMGRRSRSHSPKPESLPAGPGHNHIPKPGTNSSHIPRFYFPNGKPQPDENLQERFSELDKLFHSFEGGEASFKQFGEIMKVSIDTLSCSPIL